MLFSLLRQIPSAVPPAGKRCSWLSREAIWWEGGGKSLPHPKRSPLLLCALGGVVSMRAAAFLSSKMSQKARAWLQGCSRWEKNGSPIRSLV